MRAMQELSLASSALLHEVLLRQLDFSEPEDLDDQFRELDILWPMVEADLQVKKPAAGTDLVWRAA